MPSIGIVLAAGESRRFGSQKLLADIEGQPMLNRSIHSLLEGGVARLVVVVPPDHRLRVPLFDDPRVAIATNPQRLLGMFSSIQAGCAVSAGGDPILILPGDMPFVAPATVAVVLATYAETRRIVSPRYAGKRGHPIALPPAVRRDILEADAESTLSEILHEHEADRISVGVDDPGILRDVDTLGDLRDLPDRGTRH